MANLANVFAQGPDNLCVDTVMAEIQDTIFPNVFSGLADMQKIMKWVEYIHHDQLTSDLTSFAQAEAGIDRYNAEHPNEQLEYKELPGVLDVYSAIDDGWYVAAMLRLSVLTGRSDEDYGHCVALEWEQNGITQLADSYGNLDGGGFQHAYPTSTVQQAIKSFYPPAGLGVRRRNMAPTITGVPAGISAELENWLQTRVPGDDSVKEYHDFRTNPQGWEESNPGYLCKEVLVLTIYGPILNSVQNGPGWEWFGQEISACHSIIDSQNQEITVLKQQLATVTAPVADPKAEALIAALKSALA